MIFRTITIKDYPHLIEFWKTNYVLTPLDEFERVKLFLDKNPDLSLLAEEDGNIIGTILTSFDGRRGSLQKVVVHKDYRKKGIGHQLVTKAIEKLQSIDVMDIRFNTSEELVPFYEKCGFIKNTRPSMIMKSFINEK